MTAPTPETSTTPTPKTFSWQELATHNTPEDAWLAIRGKVYDVTHWWPKHPGGKDVILFCAGKDATQLFECYHPLRITTAYLQKSYMGELESSEHPTYPPMSDFYKTLKSRVEAYFEETKQNPKFSWSIILRSILLVAAMLAFHALGVLVVEQYRSVGLVFAALAGICSALLCLVPVHEASHASITNRPFLWRLFGSIHDLVNGASFYSWIHQHFLGHHFYTNTTSDGEGASWLPDTWDPDVVTGDPDIRRIKSGQKYHWHYQYQHIYAPILYGLLSIKFRISDFNIIFLTKKNGAIRVNNPGLWHTSIFFLGKFLFVFYRLILPSFYLSFYDTMSLFLTTEFVLSYYLACAFQVNHVVPQVAWPRVDSATNTVNMDWARSQVETTIEYGHGCALTHFFTGGLNYQSIHHLVPFVSQAYYPEIAPLVKKTCAEFNVTYTVLPNFWEAFKAHLQYLRMMGHTKQA